MFTNPYSQSQLDWTKTNLSQPMLNLSVLIACNNNVLLNLSTSWLDNRIAIWSQNCLCKTQLNFQDFQKSIFYNDFFSMIEWRPSEFVRVDYQSIVIWISSVTKFRCRSSYLSYSIVLLSI